MLIGTAIEELIRHHPALKDAVFEAIKATLAKINELGNAYEAPEDLKPYYGLLPVQPSSGSEANETVDVDMDHSRSPQSTRSATPMRAPDLDGEATNANADDPVVKSHDNVVVSFIDVFGKVSAHSVTRTNSVIKFGIVLGRVFSACTSLP